MLFQSVGGVVSEGCESEGSYGGVDCGVIW